MINNLQLEVIRRRKQLEFIKMVEDDDYSPEIKEDNRAVYKHRLADGGLPHKTQDSLRGKEPLELQDTEHPELKVGYQKNGRRYSVRTNRKRFFFPKEWKLFLKNLDNKNQARCFDILINTGARYNECKHIKKEDIDFERSTLTIKVAKIKAKKGQKFPDPRTFKLSSQFLERLKTYTKNLNDSDTIPFLTNSCLNLALKRITKKIGFKDPHMFSVHNIRKTNGNWLKACGISGDDIVDRLGHDHETFRKSYSSATVFDKDDRVGIHEILGDIVDYYLEFKRGMMEGFTNGK